MGLKLEPPSSTITYQTLTIPSSSADEPEPTWQKSTLEHIPILRFVPDSNALKPKLISSTWASADQSTKVVHRVTVDSYPLHRLGGSDVPSRVIDGTCRVQSVASAGWYNAQEKITEAHTTDDKTFNLMLYGTNEMAVNHAITNQNFSVDHQQISLKDMKNLTGIDYTPSVHDPKQPISVDPSHTVRRIQCAAK